MTQVTFEETLKIVHDSTDKESLRLMYILCKKELLIAEAVLDIRKDPQDIVARAMLIQTFFDMFLKLPSEVQEIALKNMPPEEKLWIETYKKQGLDNFGFSDKIIERYLTISSGTVTDEHVAEGHKLIEAIDKRLSELG